MRVRVSVRCANKHEATVWCDGGKWRRMDGYRDFQKGETIVNKLYDKVNTSELILIGSPHGLHYKGKGSGRPAPYCKPLLTREQIWNIDTVGCRRRLVFTTAQDLRLLLSRVLANVLIWDIVASKSLDSLHVPSFARFASSSKRLALLLCPA